MTTFRSLLTTTTAACLLAGCSAPATITITAPDADSTGHIARDFTCLGSSRPLRFRIAAVPKAVQSIALIFEEPGAADGAYVHWVVYNAPASTAWLTANHLIEGAELGQSAVGPVYNPPCSQTGLHRYTVQVLGLDAPLQFETPPTAAELRAAAQSHMVAEGSVELIFNVSADDTVL